MRISCIMPSLSRSLCDLRAAGLTFFLARAELIDDVIKDVVGGFALAFILKKIKQGISEITQLFDRPQGGTKQMGRKNNRKRSAYEKRLGFNPNKYISNNNYRCDSIRLCGKSEDKYDFYEEMDADFDDMMEDAALYDMYLKRQKQIAKCAGKTSDQSGFTEYQPKDPQHRDIWFADLGTHPGACVQNGCRPVFVISADRFNKRSNVITVVPLTSKYKHADMPSHVWFEGSICERNGKPVETGASMLLGEQITTIDKKALRGYVGKVQDKEVLEKIEKAIRAHLDLAVGTDTANQSQTVSSAAVLENPVASADSVNEERE